MGGFFSRTPRISINKMDWKALPDGFLPGDAQNGDQPQQLLLVVQIKQLLIFFHADQDQHPLQCVLQGKSHQAASQAGQRDLPLIFGCSAHIRIQEFLPQFDEQRILGRSAAGPGAAQALASAEVGACGADWEAVLPW